MGDRFPLSPLHGRSHSEESFDRGVGEWIDRPIKPDCTLRGFDRGVGEWGDWLGLSQLNEIGSSATHNASTSAKFLPYAQTQSLRKLDGAER